MILTKIDKKAFYCNDNKNWLSLVNLWNSFIYLEYLQPTVSPDVLERYIALEEFITEAEKNAPGMVLQQKTEQLQQLNIRIKEQNQLVQQLKDQA